LNNDVQKLNKASILNSDQTPKIFVQTPDNF